MHRNDCSYLNLQWDNQQHTLAQTDCLAIFQPQNAPLPVSILGLSWGHFGLQNPRFGWGLALGAHKPAKIPQHKVDFSLDSLNIPIPRQFCHFLASKCSPSWPNLGQSWGNVGLQNAGFSWGLALGAHKPAKISQHKVNFSPDSLKILIPN